MIDYKYSEDRILKEMKEYIDATYGEHYSQNKFQASEFIVDSGHGEGFFIGNIMKYAQRYGKKDGHNRKDLMKVLHYAIMAIHNHDLMRK
jgi:2',3'-cyclic-nucleotide 2'-phosphodiesterase (5'-nucleotidase family)